MFAVVCQAWHIFRILPGPRKGIRSRPWVRRARRGARAAGARSGLSASHRPQWRCWRELGSAMSKGLTLLSVVHWEVSEARPVVFISPVLASGFIWQWKGWAVTGWEKKEMCATRLSLSLPRESASQFIHNTAVFCHLAALHSIQLYKDTSLGSNNLWLYFCLDGVRSVWSLPVRESKNTQMQKSATVFWPRRKQ